MELRGAGTPPTAESAVLAVVAEAGLAVAGMGAAETEEATAAMPSVCAEDVDDSAEAGAPEED